MIVRMPVPGYTEPVPMPNVVPKFSRSPGAVRSPGVELGRHTEAVRREFAREFRQAD